MIEDRHLAERMTLQVFGGFRIALEDVQLHLLVIGEPFFREHHLDRTHVG